MTAAAVAHADPHGHDDAPVVDDAEAAPGLGEAVAAAAAAAAAGNGVAAADVLPGAKIWAERPLWRAFFRVWLRACLQLVRRKYSEFTTDSLPEGRGELLHLTGQAEPEDDAAAAAASMHAPSDSKKPEGCISHMSRRGRQAPNGNTTFIGRTQDVPAQRGVQRDAHRPARGEGACAPLLAGASPI